MSNLRLVDLNGIPHDFISFGKVEFLWIIKLLRPLDDLQAPRVFLANMGSVYDSLFDTAQVVIKLANDSRSMSNLEREHLAYRQLEGIQGSFIPECYGLYEGTMNGVAYKCLVLEFCRPDVGLEIENVSRERLQCDLMLRMAAIHALGVLHGNITESNHVIVQDGMPRIITFSRAAVHKGVCLGMPFIHNFGGKILRAPCCLELAALASRYGFNRGQPPISE